MRTGALRPVAAVLLAALAAGCTGGGGGGGGIASGVAGRNLAGPNPPPVDRVPPPGTRPTALRTLAASYTGDLEYDWPLGQIDAATAYARIAQRDGAQTRPGDGARVAVIDSGIDLGHWEFDTQRITRTNQPVSAVPTHGTAVASVIAAQRDGGGVPSNLLSFDFHGVAWGVDKLQIMSVALGSADPDAPYVGIDPQDVGATIHEIAQWVSALAESDFVNMSFGARGLVENYRGLSFGTQYRQAVQTMAQQSAGAGGKTILVIAAGNVYGRKCVAPEPGCVSGKIVASSPTLPGGLPVLEASLRDNVVAVVATDSAGRIASFSNRCGIAAKWCIAAPGVRVKAAYYGPRPNDPNQVVRGYFEPSGTSFAAPYVTGGLAVLKHWFRSQMKNEELLARLYATARVTPDPVSAHGGSCPAHLDLDGDSGRCELSSIFGRGVMDLGAATAPVGTTMIALGSRAAGGGAPARSSRIVAGAAMGDAARRSLAGRTIAVFDSLGAPFWIDAARFAQAAPPADPAVRLSRWLAGEDGARAAPPVPGAGGISGAGRTALAIAAGPAGSGLRLGFGAPEGAHMSLAARPAAVEARFEDTVLSAFASTRFDDGPGIPNGIPNGIPDRGRAGSMDSGVYGLALAWRPSAGEPAGRAGFRTGLRAGWLREADTLYGAGVQGAFGRLSSDLFFAGASGSFDAGGWRFGMAAELGHAAPRAAGGLLRDAGPAFSTAFSATAARHLAGGTLRLSLQQPLRIERGRMHLSLPVGRTPAGDVVRRGVPVGLAPSGRQIDFGVDWTGAVAPGSVLRIGAVLSRHPGHDAGRRPEAAVFIGLRAALQ